MMRIKFSLFALLALGLSTHLLRGQSDLMLYNFNSIGQSLHVNPSAKQQSKFYLSLPAMSGYSLHYHNNSFSLYDIFEPNTNVNDNLGAMALGLDEHSQLTLNQQIELFGLGFKAGRGFFSFGATQNIDYQMKMPQDLFTLLFSDGQASVTNFDLNTFDLEISNRTSIYLGYQRSFMKERLRIGGRFKYLIGQQHAYIDRMNFSVRNEDNFQLVAQTDVLLRSAGVPNLSAGPIDALDLAFTDNRGMAFDLGVDFALSDRWSLSASIIDVGSITYQENTTDFFSEGEYEFNGFEADLSRDNPGEGFEGLLDSIVEAFNFPEEDGNSYTRSLMPRVFGAVNYRLSDRHTFGLIYHARIWNEQWYHDYGINYQGRLLRGLQVTGGYSIINGTQHNIGAGIQFKLGPVQLYVLSENLLGGLQYTEAYTSSVRVGLNFAFFGKRDRKKKDDEAKAQEKESES